jgi:tripartite-type tricarboxylate transporter receptor subunit TctC
VARSSNDGYTLFETTTNHNLNAFIYRNPGYAGYSHMTWIGLLAPAGTPRDIIVRLNSEVAAVLQHPEVRQRITAIGAQPVGASAHAFEAMLKADYEATAKLVAQIGLKVD